MDAAITVIVGAILILAVLIREQSNRRSIAALQDQLAATQAKLKEREELANVGQLMTGLAQELKSPLQGVLGNTELMFAAGEVPSSSEALRDIQQNAERAAVIVRSLAAVSGTATLTRRWQDLADVVARAVDACQPNLASAGLRLQVERSERLPFVYVDDRRLEKVLATLLSRPRPSGDNVHGGRPPVRLATRRGSGLDGRLIVELDETTLEVQDDSAWASEVAACRRVVEAHGGSLNVQAQRGQGFRFRLELPVTPSGSGAAEEE